MNPRTEFEKLPRAYPDTRTNGLKVPQQEKRCPVSSQGTRMSTLLTPSSSTTTRPRPPPHHPCSPTVISIISPTLSSTLALYERSQCQWDLRAVIYFVLHLQPSIDSPPLLPGRPSLNPRTYLKSSIDYIIITVLPI